MVNADNPTAQAVAQRLMEASIGSVVQLSAEEFEAMADIRVIQIELPADEPTMQERVAQVRAIDGSTPGAES